MRPSKKWTILFDETGSKFADDAITENKNEVGKGVMLLVPHGEQLPDLEKAWHAVDKPFSEIKDIVRTLLASRCAIIGIPCTALAKNGKERWFPCIEALLDLILRCLPIKGETELELLVEQRGDYKKDASMLLDKTCMDSLYHLSKADKGKAEKIKIHGRIIGKKGHPWNGYVDAVAFLWTSRTCGKLLEFTKWEAQCLLGLSRKVSVDRLCSWMDYFHRENALLPEDWSSLMEEVTTQPNQSLLINYLRNLGVQARENADLWKQYLEHTVCYLNSKAINMRILSAKIMWLKRFMPNEQELPPRLRLLWLTSQLAEENHKGCTNTFEQHRAEFRTLSEQLYEEDAPLTCDAALHLAVSHADQYDFEGAARLLEPWRERPAAIPGLQLYGRLLSSYGQHEAFMGNPQAASKHFHEAFTTFRRLSDQDSAREDISQTKAYLLTVLMDREQDVGETFNMYAQSYFKGEIKDIAPRLAASTDDHEKYQHHILLRYLHSPHASAEEKEAYRASRENWECGEGHPWEMIEFYRAGLCDEREEKLKHLDKAYGMVSKAGGVLLVIATVIAGARMQLMPEGKDEYLGLVEECRVKVPLLGDRLRILQEYAEHPYEPLTLAKQVLPFNFR